VETIVSTFKLFHSLSPSAQHSLSALTLILWRLEYISVNPTLGFDKKIKSHKIIDDKHIPYTDADLKVILEFMDNHDKYTAFFCRMIYFTCLRPKEIRGLKVENINLSNKTITIPADVKKVTSNDEKDFIEINESFIPFLNELELEKYPKHYYLTGSTTNIVGENRIGENTPYNKLIVVLKKLGLNNKGYDLYSFKHTSNIKKYMSGWSLAEIMKANRHSSITTTEIYLKKLGQFVDATGKLIPTI
jgi:integrase